MTQNAAAGAPEVSASAHIGALDGLRAIAVLMVLGQHGLLLTSPAAAPDPMFRFATLGWIGVDIFFVLSGFLITGILIDTRNSRRYLRRFYARRILRIFPIYYVALLFLLFVAPACHLVSQADADQLRENQAWYWTYLVNFLFCFHPTLSIDKFTGHFWSLAVEEQFYLVWPLLVLAISNEGLRRVSLLAIVTAFFLRAFLLAAHVGQNWIYTMLPTRVDPLAIGAWLAITLRRPRGAIVVKLWLPRITIACLAVIVAVVFWNRPHLFAFWIPKVQLVGYSAVAGIAGACVAGLVVAPPDALSRRICESSWLRRVGRYSYAMYIVHLPLMIWLHTYVSTGRVSTTVLSAPVGRFIFLIISVALSFLVAHVTWLAVEQPFLRLKRFFSYEPADGPKEHSVQ